MCHSRTSAVHESSPFPGHHEAPESGDGVAPRGSPESGGSMFAKRIAAGLAAAALAVGGAIVAAQHETPAVEPTASSVPLFDHIVLVMFENKKYSSINGSSSAPYFNSLAAQGAKFTNSFAITHPSQPNYVALLSG